MAIKRMMRRAGFDIKKYYPVYGKTIQLEGINTVLDIGANTGQFASEIRKILPQARICSFEPIKDCFESLQKNMASDKNFEAFNFALGRENTTSIIHRSSFSPSSSLLVMAQEHKEIYPKSAGATDEKIEIKRLDDVAPSLVLDKKILIKMDVQGYEDAVIVGGTKTLAEADVLIIETSFVRLYEGQPLFDEIHAMLFPLGFRYYGNNGAHHDPRNGKLLYEDSIFINSRE